MNSNKLKKDLKKYFKLPKLNDDKDLISNNILDSLSLVTLVFFIEKKLNLKCDLNKIDNVNFSSINNIVKFLKKHNKNKII